MTEMRAPGITAEQAPLAEKLAERDGRCLLELLRAVRVLSTHLEHATHLQDHDIRDIEEVGEQLRSIAVQLAENHGVSLRQAYADRLRAMEESSIFNIPMDCGEEGCAYSSAFLAVKTIESASTWSDLQIGQMIHDQHYHNSLINMHERGQLEHYHLHIAKLPDYLAQAIVSDDWEEFCSKRLVDCLSFGIKLATLSRVRLPETSFEN